MSKRPRGEEEDAADTETSQEDPSRAPALKKVRIIQRVDPEVSNVVTETDSSFQSEWKNLNASHSVCHYWLFFPGGDADGGQCRG